MKIRSLLAAPVPGVFCRPPSAQADTFDFQVIAQGGRLVAQGAQLHVGISEHLISGSPMAGVIPLSVSGLPPGVTARMPNIDNNGACCGDYQTGYGFYGVDSGGSGDWLQLSVPANTPLGDYTITVQATAPTTPPLTRSTTFVMTVVKPSDLTISPVPLSPATPIPHLAEWENVMVTNGACFCDQSNIAQYEGGVWYYDGERIFYQMANYRNEPSWGSTCAQWVENAYTPSIFARKTGQNRDTKSLRAAYEWMWKSNRISKKALHLLASADYYYAYTREALHPPPCEKSYALQAMLDDEAVNGATYPYDTTTMEAMLGQLDQIFIRSRIFHLDAALYGGAHVRCLDPVLQRKKSHPDPDSKTLC